MCPLFPTARRSRAKAQRPRLWCAMHTTTSREETYSLQGFEGKLCTPKTELLRSEPTSKRVVQEQTCSFRSLEAEP